MKRVLLDGATYHVTSRTNDRINAFEKNVGQKLMLLVLEEAREKYGFQLHNFCIMPNHFHLLITPASGTNLSRIIQWIKLRSAKRWNGIHNAENHLWGNRFFSRPVNDMFEFFCVYNYIDQNPVKAGLVSVPSEWKASGAFYIANNIDLMTGIFV